MLDKEALHILQRFAALQHENQVARSARPAFEAKLLRLLHSVCSQPGPYVSLLDPPPPSPLSFTLLEETAGMVFTLRI